MEQAGRSETVPLGALRGGTNIKSASFRNGASAGIVCSRAYLASEVFKIKHTLL